MENYWIPISLKNLLAYSFLGYNCTVFNISRKRNHTWNKCTTAKLSSSSLCIMILFYCNKTLPGALQILECMTEKWRIKILLDHKFKQHVHFRSTQVRLTFVNSVVLYAFVFLRIFLTKKSTVSVQAYMLLIKRITKLAVQNISHWSFLHNLTTIVWNMFI
jgi:hypothetical protein